MQKLLVKLALLPAGYTVFSRVNDKSSKLSRNIDLAAALTQSLPSGGRGLLRTTETQF
jgi:hypothetical protein